MTEPADNLPAGLHLSLDLEPEREFRAELGQKINEFHSQTVPFQSHRFAVRLQDAQGQLAGGLSGVMAWQWLFIEALWVSPDWRNRGVGRALMARAESFALAEGCHSVWLDSFQAAAFYQAIGYTVFGTLDNYPGNQTRSFLRKKLISG